MRNINKASIRSFRLASGLGLAAFASSISTVAMAQAAVDAAQGPVTVSDDTSEEITVTGSRIVRNGNNAATPVTVISNAELSATTPSNIPDALNKLPVFAGGRSQATINNGTFPSVGNYMNLRSFGAIRTLVLLDGRRVPPTSFEGTVDTNTLPQMLIQRVDVVTGGASAVYGSDAITGVVNYALDRKFSGLKAVAQQGISQRGDNRSWRLGLAGGFDLGENVHVVLSAEHYDSPGISRKEDRYPGQFAYVETGSGSADNPYRLTPNARITTQTYGGLITSGPLNGQMFLPGGVLATFNPGTPTGTSGINSGGDGVYYRDTTLLASLKTDQVFGRGDFEFLPGVKAFIQGSWAQSENSFYNAYDSRPPTSANKIVIFSGNAFLPASVQSILTATNTPSFTLGRLGTDYGTSGAVTRTKAVNATMGVEGNVNGWRWDASYTYGRGEFDSETLRNPNNPRFYAAVDAVRDSSGNIVCRVTLTNPTLYPGCVPINLFGEHAMSQAAADYVVGTTTTRTINRVDDFALNLSKDIFETWAGPVSLALGAEHRRQTLLEEGSVDANALPDFTGLRGGFTSATRTFARSVAGFAGGANTVTEGNLELVVPLLRDSPFGKSLEFNGAARYTHYSTSGSATTWKAALVYEPINDLRIRVVKSRDIRAPTLYDLFASPLRTTTGYADKHTGVATQTTLVTLGNPNLVPEVSQTTTAGLVYRPSWAPGFSLALDFFSIKIDNAISQVGGNSTAAQTECEDSNGASGICALFQRPLPFSDRSAANFPTAVLTQNLNVGTADTRGIDMEAGYAGSLGTIWGEPAEISVRVLGTYQPVYRIRSFPTAALINVAGTGDVGNTGQISGLPKLRATLLTNLDLGQFGLAAQVRFQSKIKPNGNPALIFADPDVPSAAFVDTTATFNVGSGQHERQLFFTVNNLLDKKTYPFITPAFAGNPGFFFPAAPGYDIAGRSFVTGIRLKF